MNRAERRAARHNKPKTAPKKHTNPLWVLNACRPYDDGEVTPEINECRLAYHRLMIGDGTKHDFDLVSMTLNAVAIRCEEIHPTLVKGARGGLQALARVKARFLKGEGLRFDENGIVEMSDALEVFEAVVQKSSPMQMVLAFRETYRRIRRGNLVEAEA